MKDLLDNGMKIQAMQSWGWFIRMLGSHAFKNKHLVNDMLKIPQRTFTDPDPQVQIATQVPYTSYCIISSMIHSAELCEGYNYIPVKSQTWLNKT